MAVPQTDLSTAQGLSHRKCRPLASASSGGASGPSLAISGRMWRLEATPRHPTLLSHDGRPSPSTVHRDYLAAAQQNPAQQVS